MRFGSASSTRSRTCSACRRRTSPCSPDEASRSVANSWIVSSIRNRTSPSPVSCCRTRLLSTNDAIPSMTLIVSPGPQTSTEGRQAREEPLFLGLEQIMAPLDRASERALPLGEVAGAAGEEWEPALEPLEQRRGTEQLDPAGGQLDGQRQGVQPPRGQRTASPTRKSTGPPAPAARGPGAAVDGRGTRARRRHGGGSGWWPGS